MQDLGGIMSVNYYVKLRHSFLEDPTIARLDNRLWRRYIELTLLAGKFNGEEEKTGVLPGIEDIAWHLRAA